MQDVVWILERSESPPENEISGQALVHLLQKNFSRLDPDNNGITREELLAALTKPQSFTGDEYAMLGLLSRYFDTVINLSDDEKGPETRITRLDFDVLAQFLVHSGLTLGALHTWLRSDTNKALTEQDVGPPPLFEG